MSEQPPAAPAAPKPRRDPALTVAMVLGGIMLLFPGLCTVYFLHGLFFQPTAGAGNGVRLAELLDIWAAFCLLIGAGGVVLIVRAILR
jgi:hypothetical protein